MKSIVEQIKAVEEANQKKIDLIRLNNKRHIACLHKVDKIMPSFETNLQKAGLGIQSIATSKTGITEHWEEDDSLKISITAIPTSKKFRFLKFAGYTSSGKGKNQNRLHEKACKLAEQLANGNSLSISVNPFSLEIKNNEDSRRVLIEMWVES